MSSSKSDAKVVTRQRVTSTNLLKYANETRSEGHFNDVTIIAENECIPGNKMVLSCHSVFFEKMFKCEMKEKYEHKVEIQSVDGKSVKTLINYIYVGSIDIDDENVMKLLAAADFLQVHDVKQFCFQYLESIITIDNWLDILKAVNMYRGDEIRNQVYHYISSHFDEIAQNDEFKTLSNDDLKDCISNLNRKKAKETKIYQGIMNWIQHDPESRKNELLELFQLMKVDQLPYDFIEEVLKEDLIENNFDCHKYLVTTLLQILRNQSNEIHGSKLISIGGQSSLSKVIEVYNMHGRNIIDYPDFPVNIFCHSLLKVNGYVYCIGGRNDCEPQFLIYNNVWLCNVKDELMNWKEASPMNEKRYLMGATKHNRKLVVAGGSNGSNILKSAECYETPSNKWQPISSMNQHRGCNALVSCQGYLYALGGHGDDGKCLSSVEQLMDLEGTWEESQPMLKPRKWFAAVNCDNVVYAIGGQCGADASTTTKTVEEYNPDKNEWVYVSEMNSERCAHAACVMHGKIYVVGGLDAGGQTIKTIECYTPSLDSWYIVGKTNEELRFHSIVAL